MEIKTHPKKPNKVIVIFDDLDEREQFGAEAPNLSRENFRHKLWQTRLLEDGEFPQITEASYRVIGRVAGVIAAGAVPNREMNIKRKVILEAIVTHLGTAAAKHYPEKKVDKSERSDSFRDGATTLWSSEQRTS